MADEKPKKLPWGLKPESLAPSSMKGLPESKLKAFQMGRNPLKGKAPSKVKEEERKKAEEAATAEVYAQYIESFQESAAVGKTFVKADVINADRDINEATSHRYHKNTSKLAELAEEFKKNKETQSNAPKLELKKKKEREKKKSNLESFKEELQRTQKERDIRHKIKKGEISGLPDDVLKNLPTSFFKSSSNGGKGGNKSEWMPPKYDDGKSEISTRENEMLIGSFDNGDPNTTNLYIGNINPKMTEEQLCKLFGQYGPLASVKIMWPRTEEEKARNRNCGFVAYMNRSDGERALKELVGKDIMGYEMRLGWGKSVPIPPQPIYVPPEMIEAQKPPPPSGLPFNAQLSTKLQRDGKQFDGNLESTIVKVVIPMERSQLAVIHRMVEFVVREGPMFEAMIMNKELNNPMFRFLFENKGHEHIYYRWKLFSILQGDTPQKWSQVEFRMFNSGSIWRPPPMNPYAAAQTQVTSQALASASSAIVHSNVPKPEKVEVVPEVPKKQMLSDSQRDKLEDMLRTVTTDRKKVGELMVWCLDHADYAEEIVDCITESLSLLETPITTKVARIYVVSDILHNSGAKIHHASHFRREFENKLAEIMDHLRAALVNVSSKATSEKFRKQVLSCLAAWQDWSVYPPGFLIKLQNTFVGLSENKKEDLDGFPLAKDSDIDGRPMKDDLDGVPVKNMDDVDGFPLAKADVDIDGIPLGGDIDGKPMEDANKRIGRMKASRWEPVEDETELQKSRWEKEENEDEQIPKSKWEREEDNGTKNKWSKEDSQSSKWQRVSDSPKDSEGTEDSRSYDSPSVHVGEMDESRRRMLREVELKVMKYADKLELNGLSKSGETFKKELEHYRQSLVEEYERERRKRGRDRKRDRSRSSSPIKTPSRNASSPRRRKSHRSRSRSFSNSDESSTEESSRSSRKHKMKRSRSSSKSPTRKSSSSKKKRKKSRK